MSQLIKFDKTTYLVFQEQENHVVPFYCPNCNILLRNLEDEQSYRDFFCCNFCADIWARPNKEKWLSGWRPAEDVIKQQLDTQRVRISVLY
jgi:hypothetical protein